MNIYFETYGCTANHSDTALMKGQVSQHGHQLVQTIETADVIILVTCTVIDTTEQRMLSRLHTLSTHKKPLIVTGCMANVQQTEIKKHAPNAVILPLHQQKNLVSILDKKKTQDMQKNQQIPHFNTCCAPIGISEGCTGNCSYCITRIARGSLQSYPETQILTSVKAALQQQCKELQLTAQDLASYGQDTKTSLSQLVHSLHNIPEDFRIRLGMMNPSSLLPQVTGIYSLFSLPKIYTFLHLPVQSGDNEILTVMKRRYTVEDFLSLVKTYKNTYQDGTLSTDIIVGFPGETEEQFQHTINLIKTVKPDIVNITRFSPRPLTTAKTMQNKIPTNVMKQRSKILTDLSKKYTLENNHVHIGKTYEVLITEQGKPGTMQGRTPQYKPVVLSEPVKIGSFKNVEIIDAKSTYLVGKLI